MPRLAIIGLGLIGGSIALTVKRARPEGLDVAGYDYDWDAVRAATKANALDHGARSAATAVEGAALVVIATPISQVRAALEEIAPALGDGAVVTDVASTKRDILRWAVELLPAEVAFVGGHPIAGKEQSGFGAADAELFQGKPWAITPTAKTPESAIRLVESLIALAGAQLLVIDAEEHDSYMAAISHLPLVAATALFSLMSGSRAWPELAALAGPGFRDTSRLASTNPDLSHDISVTNKENLLHWLDRFGEELRRWRRLVEDGGEELAKAFYRTQTERDAFLLNPPKRQDQAPPTDELSSGERMLSFMVGEYIVRRRKEMEKLFESRGSEGDGRR